jgi:hypothetical protein
MEVLMNKFVNALMAVTVAAGMTAASAPEAQAWRGRGVGLGVAAGIIGLGVGAAIADGYRGPRYYSRYDDGCFRGPRECHWTHRRCFENDYGDTICRGGRYICERPLVCD